MASTPMAEPTRTCSTRVLSGGNGRGRGSRAPFHSRSRARPTRPSVGIDSHPPCPRPACWPAAPNPGGHQRVVVPPHVVGGGGFEPPTSFVSEIFLARP